VKIYTKTGDGGDTGLFGGERVAKSHQRVDAYGQVDELNAVLGFALTLDPAAFERDLLESIQRDLFTLGAELATADPGKVETALRDRPRIGEPRILALEAAIDRHEARLPPLKQFILPGGASKAAALHLGRTVCRRAERAVVGLRQGGHAVAPHIPIYLNRLSDLLFVLARAANAAAGVRDVQW
jgi:cob(I)alamin adenosyltransferase